MGSGLRRAWFSWKDKKRIGELVVMVIGRKAGEDGHQRDAESHSLISIDWKIIIFIK